MDTPTIIEELTQQRDRVVAAIEALTGGRKRRASSAAGPRKRGQMSEAGRRSISQRMKARWAKAKKSGKNAL
jgi:DNA invertase Pin-like site-specific DNA recombinase